MPPSRNTVPRWWLPLLGSGCGGAAVLLVLFGTELAASGPPPGRDTPIEPLWRTRGEPRSVHLAGTGTWLPLARALAEAFEATTPEIDVVVHASIGSRGGLRAVEDSTIDVGLVSWPRSRLSGLECCEVVTVARAAVVFAAHPSVHLPPLTKAMVLDIFTGRRTRWPGGATVVPLLREEGDSATVVASRQIPGFGPAMDDARRQGRWPTLLTDAEMRQALLETPGAIGLHDLGEVLLEAPELRVASLDGQRPSAETLADGRYPLTRTLSLLLSRAPRAETRRFVDFVRSDQGRAVIGASGGYLSLAGDER